MILTSIGLVNYRNYQKLICPFYPGINLFTGANAQGKTNLIEAIYYLSVGKAYRQARDELVAFWGRQSFSIAAKFESRRGGTTIDVHWRKDEHPIKTIAAGGLRLARMEELSGAFMSVLFSPESMAVAKGLPQERRSFLNDDISQISRAYCTHLQKYKRLLAQRNALLKKLAAYAIPISEKKSRLSIWDDQLIHYGGAIVEKRMDILEKLSPLVRLAHRRITDGKENLEIQYQLCAKDASLSVKQQSGNRDICRVLSELKEISLAEDLRFGSTQWGPHRDDVRIAINGADLRQACSQGQQRTGILALKLAELEIFRAETGEFPVLLLDDVLSELDEDRQDQLIKWIQEKAIQCVITAAERKRVTGLGKKPIRHYLVEKGEIRAET